MYSLTMGQHEKTIASQSLRFAGKLPDKIENSPVLKPELELYLKAFFDLNADRQTGFEIGRIPWSKIAHYSDYYHYDDEQKENLFDFITALDDVYLKHVNKKGKK